MQTPCIERFSNLEDLFSDYCVDIKPKKGKKSLGSLYCSL